MTPSGPSRSSSEASSAQFSRFSSESPEPSAITTPSAGSPEPASHSRIAVSPASVLPVPAVCRPISLTSISTVVLSEKRSASSTISAIGSDSISVRGAASGGAVPAAGAPATVTPRSSSRSVSTPAACTGGSAPGPDPGLQVSSTTSAESGATWPWVMKRSGQVATVRTSS